MSMLDWAKKEIEIAVARERLVDGSKEGEFSYGGACYESALKAFESLCEDGHSGMSIKFKKTMLNRLIDGKPLTPIDDTDDIWECSNNNGFDIDYDIYQCKRMSSLFKEVYPNGRIIYRDVDRYYCLDVLTGSTYRFGMIERILNELYPITMPYMPEDKPYIFMVEELKLQDTAGDFDTIVVHSLHKPDGEIIELNRYYTEDEIGRMVEIEEKEYNKMVDAFIRGVSKEHDKNNTEDNSIYKKFISSSLL